jgi:hypothetical protein
MVIWESRADRGRRPPNRGRGQRFAASSKPAPSRENTPTKEAGPAPAPAPRGSPIARKLARHLTPWTTLTIPQMAVKVSPPYPFLLTLHCPLPASPLFGRVQSIDRSRPGTATFHRRALCQERGPHHTGFPVTLLPHRGPDSSPAFSRGTSFWSSGLEDQQGNSHRPYISLPLLRERYLNNIPLIPCLPPSRTHRRAKTLWASPITNVVRENSTRY